MASRDCVLPWAGGRHSYQAVAVPAGCCSTPTWGEPAVVLLYLRVWSAVTSLASLAARLARRCLQWEEAEQLVFRCVLVLFFRDWYDGVRRWGPGGAPASCGCGACATVGRILCLRAGAQAAAVARPAAICGREKWLIPVQIPLPRSSLEALPFLLVLCRLGLQYCPEIPR